MRLQLLKILRFPLPQKLHSRQNILQGLVYAKKDKLLPQVIIKLVIKYSWLAFTPLKYHFYTLYSTNEFEWIVVLDFYLLDT
jgi:hypothetical protein